MVLLNIELQAMQKGLKAPSIAKQYSSTIIVAEQQ